MGEWREEGARSKGPKGEPLRGHCFKLYVCVFWESEKYEPAAGAWGRGEDLVGVTI